MATLVFCHGRESGPQGYKISRLRPLAEARGWQVVTPDFRDIDDPDIRVELLLGMHACFSVPLLLIGSSMGGYVAARAAAVLNPDGLLLLAPAIGLAGYRDPSPVPVANRIEVIHGWRDSVIAPQAVFDWAGRNRLTLHQVDDDHPLTQSIAFLRQRLELMLEALASPLA
jgi:pimeloyl-ACP methyl ester carboxylesterase